MRVRTMDANGDMTFGGSGANFLINSPAAVRQLCQTRLLLWEGEWFLDTTQGTPYPTQILGSHTQPLYDAAIQAVLLGTPGVIQLDSYSSSLDGETRVLTIQATLTTQFGQVSLGPPGQPGISGGAPAALPVLVLNLDGRNALGSIILG